MANVLCDVIAIVLLLYVFNYLHNKIAPHHPNYNIGYILQSKHSVLAWLWKTSLILSGYIFLRIFKINVLISLLVSLSLLCMLYVINAKKMAILYSPVSFSDLFEFTNFYIAIKYVSLQDWLWVCLGGAVFVILYLFMPVNRRLGRQSHNYSAFLLLPWLFLTYVALFPIMNSALGDHKLNEYLVKYQNKLSLQYTGWSWEANIINNGLLYHIVQTSLRQPPPEATEDDVISFQHLAAGSNKTLRASGDHQIKNIIFILCEACWYDEDNFKESYQPLFDLGFRETRSISPVYGGGTANAEFEVLTGLPSKSNLFSGVFFQEYAVSVKHNSLTLPKYLKDIGYKTYAAHNNTKGFYNRNNILVKFGFEQYDGIEDMAPLPLEIAQARQAWQWQNDDWQLYHQAIRYLEENAGQYTFMQLITMGTHGPYHTDNDYGQSAYLWQVRESVDRLQKFIQQLDRLTNDSLVIVYGDHKPALDVFFQHNKVFPKAWHSDDERIKIMEDVPVLVRGPDKIVSELTEKLEGKPLFCMPVILDNVVTKTLSPITQYGIDRCSEREYQYLELVRSYERWLYSIVLFQKL